MDGGHVSSMEIVLRVCPKDVPPIIAIAKARKKLTDIKKIMKE